MENTNAPDLTPGYPSKGGKIGPAWGAVWAELSKNPKEWRDGHTIWVNVATQFQLSPETVRALMFRMASGGRLESETHQMVTARGKRARTHFRIPQSGE